MAGLHATVTADIVGEAGPATVSKAVPDVPGSSVLAAVTITVPAVAGAVKSPVALTTPALADQATDGL